MFAAVDMSEADAFIAVWHAKYLYGFWRPITAINLADTDGNPATTADPSWTPLLTTPPYPDHVSGYSGLTGAFSRALADTLDTRDLQLTCALGPAAVDKLALAGARRPGDRVDPRRPGGDDRRLDRGPNLDLPAPWPAGLASRASGQAVANRGGEHGGRVAG